MFSANRIVTINSRKFDGKINRSWKANLIAQDDSLLTLVGEFEKEINHAYLGVIRPKTLSYEFYWLNRGYNVFRFHEPDGRFRNFYCNINLPPKFSNDVLDYIDLDIDILVWADFSFQILDSLEYEENAAKFNYSKELKSGVKKNLQEIIFRIENRNFPFDYKTESKL